MESLDRDLDRTAYEPSSATMEGVRELIKVLKKGSPGLDTAENEENHDAPAVIGRFQPVRLTTVVAGARN